MAVAQKLACRVEQIVDHGEQVYTVHLRPERPAPKFRPGQFLHLALDEYDPSGFWPESRVFSIASSPLQREQLRISYSVKGRFTARMERELAVGRRVWVKLPYGDFVIDDNSDVVLFAGGTGITAYTSFLDGLTSEFRHSVYLAYGARRRSLLIYRDVVEQRVQAFPFLRVSYFIEQDADGQLEDVYVRRSGETVGRLSVAAVWPDLTDPGGVIFYISGPPAMLKVISCDLLELGVRAEAIRTDAWE